jgi:hypothetical protein
VAKPIDKPEPLVEPEPFHGGFFEVFDLVLRGQKRLNAVLRHEPNLASVTQKLLWVSLLGLAVHGLIVGAAATLLKVGPFGYFFNSGTPFLWMPLAAMLAFVGALGLCLPTFYFHIQLSGLDASFRLVTAQALRGQATTSVLLLGVLPFYAAVALACVLGLTFDPLSVLLLGVTLPFMVGLLGLSSIYRAFSDLARYLPITHQRRGNFVRRMVLCWGAVYTVVAPVAFVRLSSALSQAL